MRNRINNRPIKRHKKLDTFREELNSIINGVEEVAKDAQEPVIEQAVQQIDAIAERFNIVQTFDDQSIISGQMELLWQDLEALASLISVVLKRPKVDKELTNRAEEELLLILASEVF